MRASTETLELTFTPLSSAAMTEKTGDRDQELVRAAQNGDVAAFEAIYRLHAPRIHGLCLRMLADATRAEELTQDVFVRAWRKLGSFRGRSAFSTWLHRLAVNVVLSHLRSRRRHHLALVDLETVPAKELRGPRHTTATGLDIERAVSQLPPRARMVFVLHEIQGLRHEEVAEAMGISTGASKAHLHRARSMLQKVLDS